MSFTRDNFPGNFPDKEPPVLSPVDDDEYGRQRRRWFVITALPLLLVGLVYTLLQPRVYMSNATVLMSAPTAIDQTMLEANVQGVAIQGRILTGSEITLALSSLLENDYGENIPPLKLRGFLEVAGVPETNLLELRAMGSDASLLPPLVEAWIGVYADIRSRDIESLKSQTLSEVQEELDGLDERLTQARDALAEFREEHEIISMERQENAVLSQLDGLNTALNNAVEEEVKAKAYLDTLETSLKAGEQFVPDSERAEVTALATELGELRSDLGELRARYTDDYIRKDPRLREIPQRIVELEAALGMAYAEGTKAEMDNARRAWDTALQSVAELQQRLQDHKASVADFNTIYATHESLVEDLARLEELNRETLARQVQIEVRRTEKYPQMSVVEWPLSTAERIGPPYAMLLGGSFVASILLGVFAAWLYSYLHPRAAQPAYVTLSGVHMYPQDAPEALANQAAMTAKLADQSMNTSADKSAEQIEHRPESESDSGSDENNDNDKVDDLPPKES